MLRLAPADQDRENNRQNTQLLYGFTLCLPESVTHNLV